MPMISVIIPVYNAEHTILSCMESVNHQNYENVEVIVIDDGSTDRSKEIIETYIVEHALHWIFISRENCGVAKTRNEGIQKSNGDFIAFLDSDDVWMEEKLSKQMALIQETKAVFVSTNIRQTDSNVGYQIYHLKDLLRSNKVCTSTVLVSKAVLNDIGCFNENMQYSEDYNLWLRIVKKYPIYIMNEILTKYNENSQGLSSHLWKMEKGELSNYKELLNDKTITFLEFVKSSLFSVSKFMIRIFKR